ncbi:MAG: CoA pyrophosphatase [Caldilineaceae bacterium]|nr:CoA pyrophosphatase [Caldilineaceae bacterium]
MRESYESFLHQLRRDLEEPLPGKAAQFRMAPRPRSGGEIYNEPTADARQGAVLVLFYPWRDQIYLPLILRPHYGGVHSGQMALPGGGYEEIDADLTATALREAYEEVGVRPETVTILGQLSTLFVSPSNYMVQPVVGWTDFRPRFHLDPYEVAALIEAPLHDFLRPEHYFEEEWQMRNRVAMVPFFKIEKQVVWGATAMMLSELLALPAVRQLEG